MCRRKRVVLWSFVVVTGWAAVATAVLVFARPARPTPAERLIGSWEGEGAAQTRLDINVAGAGAASVPLSTRISVKATFYGDGMLAWSQRVEGEGFRLSIEVPDPHKPGDIGRWEILRAEGDILVLRIIGPGGPEYAVSFRGQNEFTMTPVDLSKNTGPVLFRRVTPK